LRLFRSRVVTGANLVQGLLVVGMFGTFFLGSLYLQEVRGYGPLQIGLAFLPATLVMGVMSLRLAAGVTRRFGEQPTLVASLVVLTGGVLLMARLPVDGSYLVDVAPAMVLTGLGAGLGFPALTGMAMSAATPADSGVASGLYNTTVQVGGAIGLAALTALATSRTGHLTAAGAGPAEALTGGYHLAFLGAATTSAVAVGLAVVLLRPERPAPVEATADLVAVAD
jgi:MFS family permease